MKFLFLFAALSLVACSGGPDEKQTEPTDNTYSVMSPRPQPAPPEEPDASTTTDNHCVVMHDWVNDCQVTTVICDGLVKRIDVMCGGDYNPFSWKNIPDPPPPWVDNNGSRRNSN